MRHIKKVISMLLIVCMLGLTAFGEIGALGADATVKAADETVAMKELTFADFGIADGEYSAAPYSETNINALKHCNQNTAFKNTVFRGNFLFPTPESGARSQSSRVIFGSKNAWEGFYFSVNPAGSIMQFYIGSVVEEGANDTGFFIRTDQGTHNNWIGSFVDKEFKLEISFEAVDSDGDGSEDDAKVKIFINDKQCELFRSDNSTFYDEWYIQGAYSKGNLTNNIYFQNTNADNTIQISSVKTEKKLREVSFKDVGFAEGYCGGKTYNYAYSLKDTVVSSKVTLSDSAHIMYGSTSWNTFIVQKTAAGTFKMYKNGSGPTLLGDTATIYAYETDFENMDFESQFVLSVTTEAYDCDGDGAADDAKVGFWADGNLLGNRYFGFQDQFVDGKTMNGFYMYYVTFEYEPWTLPSGLKELTLDDFGMESGIYTSSSIAGPFGDKKPSTLMDTVLTMDVEVSGEESWIQYASNRSYYWDGLCLQFNSNGNLYAQFWKQSDESVWHAQETITPEDAGLTSFRDNKFSLSISLERCSLDLDHADNDIQVGLWFNGKLAKGQYLFVKDHADNVPTGMGVFTSRWSNGESTIKLNYEPDPVLSEELTKLTLEDFGVASGIHSSSSVAGAYGTKKPATLLDTVFTVDVEASGEEAWIQYAATRSAYYWDGLMLHFNTSDVIYVDFWEQEDGSEWLPQATITPEDAGLTTFRDQKFKLQISLERWDADGDGENNDVRVGFWFNGKLAKKTYYYVKDQADNVPTGMGVFTSRWSNGESTLKLDYVPEPEISEELTQLTIADFGVVSGIHTSSKVAGAFASKKPATLLDTVFTVDVETSGAEAWLQYASTRSAYYWDGLMLRFNTSDVVYVDFWQQSASESWLPQATITPEDAGLTTFRDQKFKLQISLERWDADGDGENNDVRVGLWFNGKLAKNTYYYVKDQADNVPTGMGVFTSRWSNGESTLKLDYVAPEVLSEKLRKLTLNDFGMATKAYTSSAIAGPFGSKKPSSLLNTVLSLDVEVLGTESWIQYAANQNVYYWNGLMIRFNTSDVVYVDFWQQSSSESWHPQATITPTDAGLTTFRNEKFRLDISIERWDVDEDGENNDVRVGLWFNGTLAKNQYYYIKDQADNVPTGMGLFTSRWSNGESTIKLATPTYTNEKFDEMTLEDMGVAPGEYTSANHGHLTKSNEYTNMDGKMFSTDIRFNSYDSDLFFGCRMKGTNNYWYTFKIGAATAVDSDKNSTSRVFRATDSTGKFGDYVLDAGIAGVMFMNNTYNLKISNRQVDCDGDGEFDDWEIGVWFNDVLYNNAYWYATDAVEWFEPHLAVYCASDRGSVSLGTFEQTTARPVTYCMDDCDYFVDGDEVWVDGVEYGKSKRIDKPGVYNVAFTNTTSEGTTKYLRQVIVYKTQDATGDGQVDVRDLVALKRYEAGIRVLDEAGKVAIDTADSMRAHLLVAHKKINVKEFSEDILGQNGSGDYIANLDATEEGTAILSITDKEPVYETYSSNASELEGCGLDFVLDFNFEADRDVRVLQITDPQIMDFANVEELLYAELDKLMEETKPDVILLTGDIVYGSYDMNGTSLQALSDKLDSYKIPWAPILGNHEQEMSVRTQEICDMFTNAKYALFTRRNEIGGNGNYVIGIAKNGKIQRTIYMLDSAGVWSGNAEDTALNQNGYQVINKRAMFQDEQIAWYRSVAARVNEHENAEIPSLMCFHWAPAEVVTAMVENGHQPVADTSNVDYKYDLGTATDLEADFGAKGDAMSSSGANMKEYIYTYLQSAGTDGVFFGHDHLNSLSLNWQGIRWTFGLKTGQYESHPDVTGGTLVTISKDDGSFTVEHKPITMD